MRIRISYWMERADVVKLVYGRTNAGGLAGYVLEHGKATGNSRWVHLMSRVKCLCTCICMHARGVAWVGPCRQRWSINFGWKIHNSGSFLTYLPIDYNWAWICSSCWCRNYSRLWYRWWLRILPTGTHEPQPMQDYWKVRGWCWGWIWRMDAKKNTVRGSPFDAHFKVALLLTPLAACRLPLACQHPCLLPLFRRPYLVIFFL